MTSQAEIVAKYAGAQTKLYMTIEEAEALSRELAARIRPLILSDLADNRAIVVGIANGGLMIAKIVAEALSTHFEIIHVRRQGSRLKRALSRFRPLVHLTAKALHLPLIRPVLVRIIDRMNKLESGAENNKAQTAVPQETVFAGRHVVLIDDCIQTGQSIFFAKKVLAEAGAKAVTTGVITLKNLENDARRVVQFSPIVYLNTRIQHYPWSQNNADYSEFLSWLKVRGINPWV